MACRFYQLRTPPDAIQSLVPLWWAGAPPTAESTILVSARSTPLPLFILQGYITSPRQQRSPQILPRWHIPWGPLLRSARRHGDGSSCEGSRRAVTGLAWCEHKGSGWDETARHVERHVSQETRQRWMRARGGAGVSPTTPSECSAPRQTCAPSVLLATPTRPSPETQKGR